MRIDPLNSAVTPLVNEAGSKPAGALGIADTAGDEDRTTLTSDKGSVSSLVSLAMQTPEIRDDKVASLQQAVSNGQYELDPGKIAASMIDEHA